MAFTKNTIFYKTWTSGDWKYKLEFIPGDTTALSTPTEVEFPNSVLLSKCNTRGDYEDNVGLGMPLTGELDIELNFSGLTDVGANDWTTVREWISRGYSATTTGGTPDIYVPNIWILRSNNGSGSTYTHYEFRGCQDIKPTQKHKITQEGKTLFEIKAIELIRSTMERISLTDTLTDIYWRYGGTEVTRLYDVDYEDANYKFQSYWDVPSGEHAFLYPIFAALSSAPIASEFTTLAEILTRVGTATVTMNYPYNHVTLYDSTLGLAKNNALAWNAINVLSHIVDNKNNTIGGMFSDNKKDETLYTYKSLWDLYREICETAGSKTQFDYNASGKTVEVSHHKIFATTGEAPAGSKVLEKTDFIGDINITPKYNLINRIAAVYKEAGQYDLDQYEEKMNNGVSYGTDSEETQETELTFHNAPVLGDPERDKCKQDANSSGGTDTYYRKFRPSYRSLYTNDGHRINSGLYADFGDGKTLTSTYAPIPPFMRAEYYTDYDSEHVDTADVINLGLSTYYNGFQSVGLVGVYAYACYLLMSNPSQGLLESQVSAKLVLPRYLGDMFTIDTETITGIDLGYSPISDFGTGNAILTGCETDFINGTSNVQFFLRGD